MGYYRNTRKKKTKAKVLTDSRNYHLYLSFKSFTTSRLRDPEITLFSEGGDKNSFIHMGRYQMLTSSSLLRSIQAIQDESHCYLQHSFQSPAFTGWWNKQGQLTILSKNAMVKSVPFWIPLPREEATVEENELETVSWSSEQLRELGEARQASFGASWTKIRGKISCKISADRPEASPPLSSTFVA